MSTLHFKLRLVSETKFYVGAKTGVILLDRLQEPLILHYCEIF